MTSEQQIVIVQRSQLAGSNLPYEVDVGEAAVAAWAANASIGSSEITRPTSGNETGFLYRASADGQTGASEPAWPTMAGGTVIDGSITWTAVVPPTGGEDAIASVTWTQLSPPDAALLITAQTHDSVTASAYLGGGTAGNTYVVVVEVTMTSTAIHVAQIVLTIR